MSATRTRNDDRLRLAGAEVAATQNATGGSCGCGRLVPLAVIREAGARLKRVTCSTCGAVGFPGDVAAGFFGERGCCWCGCPEFHDGEDCPLTRKES